MVINMNNIISIIKTISIVYLLIGLLIGVGLQYLKYNMWSKSTFGVIWFFNLVLFALLNFITSKDSLLILIISGSIESLINTAIESFAYKKAKSFIGYILWQFVFAIPFIIILGIVAFFISRGIIDNAKIQANMRSAESIKLEVNSAYQKAYLNNHGIYPSFEEVKANFTSDTNHFGTGDKSNTIISNNNVECTLNIEQSNNKFLLIMKCDGYDVYINNKDNLILNH